MGHYSVLGISRSFAWLPDVLTNDLRTSSTTHYEARAASRRPGVRVSPTARRPGRSQLARPSSLLPSLRPGRRVVALVEVDGIAPCRPTCAWHATQLGHAGDNEYQDVGGAAGGCDPSGD
jgi:hypothetical protein